MQSLPAPFLPLPQLGRFSVALLLLASCDLVASQLELTSFRVRGDAGVSLNATTGWAAAEREGARIAYDEPFRLRVEVEAGEARSEELRLEYRKRGGKWHPIGLSRFPYPLYATPEISIIEAEAFTFGEETEDVLTGALSEHEEGLGLSGLQVTPLFHLSGQSIEWEWPLVLRRFYDGPGFNEDETQFEVRVVDRRGKRLRGLRSIVLTGYAPDGHLGGTFIETPSRIGPYQTSSGRLYFLMEPTETDNRFMVVASDDGGRNWREVDGSGRPSTGDLEGVGAAFYEGVIHILHQTSDAVFYHAFATDNAARSKDRWLVDSEVVDTPDEPPTQSASLAALPDGRLVAVYGGATGGFVKIRDGDGLWQQGPQRLETSAIGNLSGFEVAAGAGGEAFIAYTARDGTGWFRTLDAGGVLSKPHQLSSRLGRSEEEHCSILPVTVLPCGSPVFIYREVDGRLFERRWATKGKLTEAVLIPTSRVATGVVDSDQVGADVVQHGGQLHLLYIDEASHSINYATTGNDGRWTDTGPLIGKIDAAWVRGTIIHDPEGAAAYGFVYDAGSQGGAGMNSYSSLPLK